MMRPTRDERIYSYPFLIAVPHCPLIGPGRATPIAGTQKEGLILTAIGAMNRMCHVFCWGG
jgi:hypothetical protein